MGNPCLMDELSRDTFHRSESDNGDISGKKTSHGISLMAQSTLHNLVQDSSIASQ